MGAFKQKPENFCANEKESESKETANISSFQDKANRLLVYIGRATLPYLKDNSPFIMGNRAGSSPAPLVFQLGKIREGGLVSLQSATFS